MITLTSILASCLFALGVSGAIKTTPLGKIDRKPWNCDVCLAFWGALVFAVFYFGDAYIDIISSPERTTNLPLSILHASAYLALIFAHGFIGAGAGYYLSRAYPQFKLKKSPAPVEHV